MKSFLSLLGIEFKRIFSNGVVIAILFGAPLTYGILFGFTYKQAKMEDLPIAVVDLDQSNTSSKFIDALDDNEFIKVISVYNDNLHVKEALISNGYQGIITIPANFESDINQRRYPEINVDLNMANILTANFVSRGIQTVMGSLNAGIEMETLKKQGLNPEYAAARFEAFKTNYNRLFNKSSNYEDFMWPGLMGAIMQQVLLLALALVFARDFEDGYFTILIKHNSVSFYHIALKAIPFYLLVTLIWAAVAVMHKAFHLPWNILNREMFILVFVFTSACISLGMLFSILIPNQLRATEFLMVIATPSFVLSGFTWPASGMPQLLVAIGNALPITHFLSGFRKIAIYGGNMQSICTELKTLTWMVVIFFILMIIVLQLKIWRLKKTANPSSTEA